MKSDNPPVLNASDPDADDADRADDADPKTDILAFESKIDSGKAEKEKEIDGLPVGNNKKDAEEDDAVDEINDVEGKRWKLKTVLFVLFVIGTVTTLSILLTRDRNGPIDPTTIDPTNTDPTTMTPTDPPTTTIRFSGMANVIGSSFEDNFPNSPLQVSALVWLANEDPAKLEVDTNPTALLERYTAALFYDATQGNEWTDQSGWLSENPICSWSGLDCTDEGIITKIDIDTNNVNGQIPSELALLTNLEYVDLASNVLTGPIPLELGLLIKLTDLYLSSNGLTGTIPSELALLTNLDYLDLRKNALSGPIPSNLGLLPHLTFLHLESIDKFRQKFTLGNDRLFTDAEILLFEELYENYTADFALDVNVEVDSTCEVTMQAKFGRRHLRRLQIESTLGRALQTEPPTTFMVFLELGFTMSYTSVYAHVTRYPAAFKDYVSEKLIKVVEDMRELGLNVTDAAAPVLLFSAPDPSEAPTVTPIPTIAATMTPTFTSFLSHQPSSSHQPSFETPRSTAFNKFRQKFTLGNDRLFTDAEILLFQGLYENYTAEFALDVNVKVDSTCEVYFQAKLQGRRHLRRLRRETTLGRALQTAPPTTFVVFLELDFTMSYTSVYADVTTYPADFKDYVSENLSKVVEDMQALGLNVTDAAAPVEFFVGPDPSEAPTVTSIPTVAPTMT